MKCEVSNIQYLIDVILQVVKTFREYVRTFAKNGDQKSTVPLQGLGNTVGCNTALSPSMLQCTA